MNLSERSSPSALTQTDIKNPPLHRASSRSAYEVNMQRAQRMIGTLMVLHFTLPTQTEEPVYL